MNTTGQAALLPHAPGVYLFRDKGGALLYVGKAKDLGKRIQTYFQGKRKDVKTSAMLSRVAEIDHIVTQTEKEALILEDTLIKEHHPRYNVQLRDDKRYPYMRLSIREEFPKLTVVRRTKQDGALYFGPFPSATSVRETLRAIQKVFPLRRCSAAQFSHRTRPCLNFQMKRCLAPCCQKVDTNEYNELVQQVRLFLEGKSDRLMDELQTRMKAEAEALHFENAAKIRDRLVSLERIIEKQKMVSQNTAHRDVIALWHEAKKLGIQVLFVRGGRLLGGKFYVMKDVGLPDQEIVSSFVKQFYREGKFIPQDILVSESLEDTALLEEVLSERGRRQVQIRHLRKGDNDYDLLRMALENACQKLAGEPQGEGVLEELKERFRLPRLPRRIEGFDISNLGGGLAVGSRVVFQNGKPMHDLYRRYRVKTVSGMDDYAMTFEVLLRRFHRGKKEGDLPQLILIDGGKGQLNVGLEVLKELEIQGVDALSLAKRRTPEEEEKVFLPGRKEPIILRDASPSSLLLRRIRDEAHRFAIDYHKRLRKSKELTSILDTIPGIGAKRKRNLLEHMGGLQGIQKASVDELALVPGMTQPLAHRVWQYMRGEKTEVAWKKTNFHKTEAMMQTTINRSMLEIVQGDITQQDTHAIVNAANPTLLGGGGVDGAIHRTAGPQLLEECRTLGGCETGDAKITKGYRLKARHVIHTVGPVYREQQSRAPGLLASAYRRSLEVASETGLKSVAFPSISTGAYGYPVEEAAPVALRTVMQYLKDHPELELVRFVLFDQRTYAVYEKALRDLLAT